MAFSNVFSNVFWVMAVSNHDFIQQSYLRHILGYVFSDGLELIALITQASTQNLAITLGSSLARI